MGGRWERGRGSAGDALKNNGIKLSAFLLYQCYLSSFNLSFTHWSHCYFANFLDTFLAAFHLTFNSHQFTFPDH